MSASIERRPAGPDLAREGRVDDDRVLGRLAILPGKLPPGEERRAESLEVFRRDPVFRDQADLSGLGLVAFYGYVLGGPGP